MADPHDIQQTSLREYVSIIGRRRWLVIAAIVVAVATSLTVSYLRTPLYTATAQLTFQKQADISSAMFGTAYVSSVDVARELETSASLMTTNEMARRATVELGVPYSPTFSQSASSKYVQDTNVLQISYVSPSPQRAADIANAYAKAFVAWRLDLTKNQLQTAISIIKGKIARYSLPAALSDPGYSALQSRLQDLRVLLAMATGNYQVAAVASVPQAPSSPRHTKDGLLGLAIGLIVGIGVAFIAEQLDVRVHEQDELSNALKIPVIGRIPKFVKLRQGQAREILVLQEPNGMTSEAFRMLRGNLDFVSVDTEVSSILVTSCTQSEGKTSTVCNLAVTLARAGKRVIVVEADLRRPAVHTYFGISNEVGLSTLVAGKVEAAQAMQIVDLASEPDQNGRSARDKQTGTREETDETSVRVMPSGPLPPNPGEIVTSRKLGTIIESLAKDADFVLVDSPPFMAVGDAAALAAKVDGVLLVMKMGYVTKAMVKEAQNFLAPLPCRKLGIVITEWGAEGSTYRYKYYSKRKGDAAAAPTEVVTHA
jgi:Mrp family chromosome partitioning ATPase